MLPSLSTPAPHVMLLLAGARRRLRSQPQELTCSRLLSCKLRIDGPARMTAELSLSPVLRASCNAVRPALFRSEVSAPAFIRAYGIE